MRQAVFLDRDGVINRALVRNGLPYPPSNLSELEILPGVHEALHLLHEAGFFLVAVTNQPDVARGVVTRETVEQINQYLKNNLPIDDFRTCFHDSGDACPCRKPLPGSLIESAKLHSIDLTKSFMVGDRWRDIEAGHAAGCTTFFIDYHYNEKQPQTAHFRVGHLLEAAHVILGKRDEKSRRIKG